MNDSIREVIANLLSRKLKEQQVDVHQITLFPFKRITLKSTQPVEEVFPLKVRFFIMARNTCRFLLGAHQMKFALMSQLA